MRDSLSWPAVQAEELTIGDPLGCVGVCCLWTDRHRLAAGLDPRRYAALGNLYSSGGLGLLVRSLLANPRLRYLVVCGADLTGSGATLVALFERGLDPHHRVAGTDVPFDPGVPAWAVDQLRARVTLLDLRGTADPDRINALLESLPPLPPDGEPLVFPQARAPLEVLPSEGAAYLVRQQTVARAWLEALKLATQFGQPASDEAGTPFRELLDLVAVVWEPPDRLGMPSWLPIARDAVEREADALRPLLRRLVAEPTGRPDPGPPAPPSPLLSPVLRGDELVVTAVYPRLDLARDWPPAALALRVAQGHVAAELGRACGPLVLIALAARLAAEALEPLRALVQRHAPRQLPWQSDPRGIFRLRLADGQILVEHGVQDLGPSGRSFSGTSAEKLYKAIVHAGLVLLPEHAAYLGAELQKAEIALRLRLPYVQDEPLQLPTV